MKLILTIVFNLVWLVYSVALQQRGLDLIKIQNQAETSNLNLVHIQFNNLSFKF